MIKIPEILAVFYSSRAVPMVDTFKESEHETDPYIFSKQNNPVNVKESEKLMRKN